MYSQLNAAFPVPALQLHTAQKAFFSHFDAQAEILLQITFEGGKGLCSWQEKGEQVGVCANNQDQFVGMNHLVQPPSLVRKLGWFAYHLMGETSRDDDPV